MVMKIKGEEYYLVSDLERILPLKIDSIRAYLRAGRIKGKKIGTHWYTRGTDLKEFLERGSRDFEVVLKSKVES